MAENGRRIDLTQFEQMIETANAYMDSWFKGTVIPMNGEEWRDVRDLGLHVDWSHENLFGPLVEEFPALIAELKRCYDELSKWNDYAAYVENVFMDCHKDASAEAGFLWKCTNCGAHFELPEDGIYECEFGCDASE